MLAILINVLWVPAIVLASAIIGFLMRKGQLAKSQRRILSLENEMLQNHAEILRLQQDLARAEKSVPDRSSSTPVVPMKDSSATDDSQKNAK